MIDDLSDRFETVVDPEAEPVDFDEVLAEFVLRYVCKRGGAIDPEERGSKDIR